ncbi:MAG TPA: 1,2-phenylacetyl-CoA epoxidase subunit PaaD [Candidatus Limnocylindrales bacterium]|nr:1,2-phenylacetyl-CoA epoxidase subunit PaaD [Candidatus Limnocylindrales bacterium]
MTSVLEAGPAVTREAIIDVLGEVPDPEIPNVSVVELGMIGKVEIESHGRGIRVELLPTFVGCPAIEVIREAIAHRLEAFGVRVRVDVSFATPWSSDRISPAGREKLRGSGFAPPAWVASGRPLPMLEMPLAGSSTTSALDLDGPVSCPFCGSKRTSLQSAFGPTLCRMVWHCAECRQPFEAFKPV